jgi:PDZ domain-containing protein
MSRLRATLALGLVLAAALALFGATVRVPFVALGPGPTFDVLRPEGGQPVIATTGLPSYPTGGDLRMTTVSISDGLTLFDAMGRWAAGDSQVLPRETVYPPGQSDQQVDAANSRQFSASEESAKIAGLTYLGVPLTVQVSAVSPGSPAAAAGLREGDRLLAVDGRPVPNPDTLVKTVSALPPGSPVSLRVGRGPQELVVGLRTVPRPEDPRASLIGLTPAVARADLDRVRISLQGVGGPSAGLVFSLGLVDTATPGPLVPPGTVVAGTGTIDSEGEVGPIGGIPFKLRAAHDVGARLFLVPSANCAEAVDGPPDGMVLARTTSLASAVASVQAFTSGRPVETC